MRRIASFTKPLGIAVLVLAVVSVAQADERAAYNEIRQKLSAQQLDAALALFTVALEEYPDSVQIRSLHSLVGMYLRRAGRNEEALQHYQEALQHARAAVEARVQDVQDSRSPAKAAVLPNLVSQMMSAFEAAGQLADAGEELDRVLGVTVSLQADAPDPQLAAAIAQLQTQKAVYLRKTGQLDEALQLIGAVVGRARRELEADPDNTDKALALSMLLANQITLAPAGQATDDARREHMEFLTEQVTRHSDNLAIVTEYANAQLGAVNQLYRSDAAAAETQLQELESFLKESEHPAAQSLASRFADTFTSLKRSIEAAKVQQALIGQPAFPLDAHAWVNGEPLSDGDLAGKVVLLDFWAVWCGPCIATFPHLREWRERFSDQGFVIIGATRHYGYDWDDEAKAIKRVADLAPEEEEAAMLRFAEHHNLKHAFMVMPKGSDFSQKYGVLGIPTAVLIDREGIIRMLRVGSGEENAHALESMIEELLAADASAAGG